jgi:hypothetical protein
MRAETCSDVAWVIYTREEVVAKETVIVVFICDTHATGGTHFHLTPTSLFLLGLLSFYGGTVHHPKRQDITSSIGQTTSFGMM